MTLFQCQDALVNDGLRETCPALFSKLGKFGARPVPEIGRKESAEGGLLKIYSVTDYKALWDSWHILKTHSRDLDVTT